MFQVIVLWWMQWLLQDQTEPCKLFSYTKRDVDGGLIIMVLHVDRMFIVRKKGSALSHEKSAKISLNHENFRPT